jgi:hypothetical protein
MVTDSSKLIQMMNKSLIKLPAPRAVSIVDGLEVVNLKPILSDISLINTFNWLEMIPIFNSQLSPDYPMKLKYLRWFYILWDTIHDLSIKDIISIDRKTNNIVLDIKVSLLAYSMALINGQEWLMPDTQPVQKNGDAVWPKFLSPIISSSSSSYSPNFFDEYYLQIKSFSSLTGLGEGGGGVCYGFQHAEGYSLLASLYFAQCNTGPTSPQYQLLDNVDNLTMEDFMDFYEDYITVINFGTEAYPDIKAVFYLNIDVAVSFADIFRRPSLGKKQFTICLFSENICLISQFEGSNNNEDNTIAISNLGI